MKNSPGSASICSTGGIVAGKSGVEQEPEAQLGEAPQRMSRCLQAVKEPVARRTIRYLKRNAPQWLAQVTVREGPRLRHRFWQPGGGYDRSITTALALRAVIDYIQANPGRRGLVARAADWQWSSARWYAGLRPAKLEMDQDVLTELARG